MTTPIQEMYGEMITEVIGLEPESQEVIIKTDSGKTFTFYHEQDCCECVILYDIDGELENLVGGFVMWAEARSELATDDFIAESGTWTFYDIQTSKGYVWMRWLGESNGYYGGGVTVCCDFQDENKEPVYYY